jgi:hypothetical protein
VRIVGVSVDEDKDRIQQRVTEDGWTRIEHLTLLGCEDNHPLIKDFEIQGIPFVCLVNKWGKIDHIGHSVHTDLQKRIN